MANSTIRDAIPYVNTDARALHVESGVAPEFGGGNCVPMAFAHITAGNGVSVPQAYRFWHDKFTASMATMGLKSTASEGVPYTAIHAALRDMNGGALDSPNCPAHLRRGWQGFQAVAISKRQTFTLSGVSERKVRRRETIAQVARTYRTAVIGMMRPAHTTAVVDGVLRDGWNAQYQRGTARQRKAYNIYIPTAGMMSAIRQAIRRDEAQAPTPRKPRKRAIPAEQAALF